MRASRTLGAGNDDMLMFRGAAFGGLARGFAGARFEANADGLAATAAARFIYETDTGILRYDSNGSAAGGSSVIATLLLPAVMTAGDIFIF